MRGERLKEILEIVRSGYNNLAIDFDATRKKPLWSDIHKFTSEIEDGGRVLDVACGNGRLLEALKDKKVEYLGVDNSESLLNLAGQNYPDRSFLFSDMLDLKNVSDGCFNHVFCLAALQHIPTQELRVQALKNMGSKMAGNGRLIISNWNLWTKPAYRRKLLKRYFLNLLGFFEDDWNDLFFPWKDSSGQEKDLRYYHAFTKRELKIIASLSNLKIKKFYKDKYNFWLELVK